MNLGAPELAESLLPFERKRAHGSEPETRHKRPRPARVTAQEFEPAFASLSLVPTLLPPTLHTTLPVTPPMQQGDSHSIITTPVDFQDSPDFLSPLAPLAGLGISSSPSRLATPVAPEVKMTSSYDRSPHVTVVTSLDSDDDESTSPDDAPLVTSPLELHPHFHRIPPPLLPPGVLQTLVLPREMNSLVLYKPLVLGKLDTAAAELLDKESRRQQQMEAREARLLTKRREEEEARIQEITVEELGPTEMEVDSSPGSGFMGVPTITLPTPSPTVERSGFVWDEEEKMELDD